MHIYKKNTKKINFFSNRKSRFFDHFNPIPNQTDAKIELSVKNSIDSINQIDFSMNFSRIPIFLKNLHFRLREA